VRQLARWRTLLADKGKNNPVLAGLLALANDSAIYLVGVVMIGLGNLVLVPLYTRHLTLAEFGVYALVDITVLILVTVTQLGFGVSYLKWFAELDPSRRGELLGSTLMISSLAAALGGGFLMTAVASPLGEQWLQTSNRSFGWTLLPIVVLENMQGLLLTDLRAQRRPLAYSVSAVGRLLAIVGASLWFIIVQKQGMRGVFLGKLVGDGIGILMLAAFCLRATPLYLSWPLVGPMIRYGLPLIWSGLLWMMLDASSRYFLGHYSSLEQVGLYGAAIKVSNVFQMLVTQPFSVAWGGVMFQIAKRPHPRLIYGKIIGLSLVLSVIMALVVALFGPALFALFTSPAYFPALTIFPLLLLVRVIQTLDYPVSAGVYVSGKTQALAVIWSVGLGVNVMANLFLTPRYGGLGASLAWVAGELTIAVLLGLAGQWYYRIPYDKAPFIVVTGLFVLFLGLKEIVHNNLVFATAGSLALVLAGVMFTYLSVQKTSMTLRSEQDDHSPSAF